MNKTQPLPTDALAPCPFCGAAATGYAIEAHEHSGPLQALVPDLPDHPGSYVIEGDCACGSGLIGATQAEVTERWNRRTPAPVGVEPVAEVRTIHGVTLGYLHESQPDGAKLYTADQVLAMRRVPLDRDEIRTYARETLGDVAEEAGFYDGVRWAEEKHGIKQGGQHGADI